MKPTCKVHGVITNGGAKPNIIPEESALSYFVRAPNKVELMALQKKIHACFEAAAAATGCQVSQARKSTPGFTAIHFGTP